MSEKELTMLDKMLFINENKEVLKDNILTRIDSDSVALLLFNMLIDNKRKNLTSEYQKLSNFISESNIKSSSNITCVYDIMGIIKTYVGKAYSGEKKFNIIIKRLNECEKSFLDYEQTDRKQLVKTI